LYDDIMEEKTESYAFNGPLEEGTLDGGNERLRRGPEGSAEGFGRLRGPQVRNLSGLNSGRFLGSWQRGPFAFLVKVKGLMLGPSLYYKGASLDLHGAMAGVLIYCGTTNRQDCCQLSNNQLSIQMIPVNTHTMARQYAEGQHNILVSQSSNMMECCRRSRAIKRTLHRSRVTDHGMQTGPVSYDDFRSSTVEQLCISGN